jgi:hypothetical protein
MNGIKRYLLLIAMIGLMVVRSSHAAEVLIADDISVSTLWTADNVYRLQNQVFVLPGATLTIEPGTVIASTTGLGGSLAVMPGAKIFANGTRDEPVIFTSTDDVATWAPDPSHPSGGDPKTGAWREGVNEWGNLTILGRGLVSGSHFAGSPVSITVDDDGVPGGSTSTRENTKVPDGLNRRQMEGLTAEFPGDPRVLYGGNDDNDDSGSISYVSIRYGGKVLGLGNELNGLALGGIGRETDIHHVDIMNGVDDGIEIWGGTVNLKYVNIWNIGDDSFDIDQGWRGKAQFGLIVQGYGADASQGSGVGDNCFETDGAEDSDAQPITTAEFYNFTVVGQPLDGDHGTAWRDNARIQYRNMIFMDIGEEVVKLDNSDGDGGSGYGFNGTLSWEDTWTTDYTVDSTVNAGSFTPGAFNDPAVMYTVHTSGKLAEITDSVFYANDHAAAYTQADARGVRDGTHNNVTASNSPIQKLTRGGLVVKGGKNMQPVTFINPLPANDALNSVGTAPDDGFYTPAAYRGGFGTDDNWLVGWTAAHAYGMTSNEVLVTDNIGESTVWTANNIYRLQNQVYVLPGATLTIEPGTLVQSTAGVGGSLAVTRGAKIFVNGTHDKPVIMTSTNDDLKNWHEGVNEWGNLTIMGNGLISASHFDGLPIGSNTKTPTGLNIKQMEGLTAEFAGDPKVHYGGNNDDDDSGSISYLSLRYGGRVLGLGNELNALSLGAIGRETDIHHIDIMNNVDDGIEIWGGTVNLSYVNIWNIGDDSFDVDQGWRGKAQFGLIVQGYSADASQGSGVGDNCIETDGAEDSDAQPITTALIYNFTVVGQPLDGDHGTAWRDNARVQYRNMIFMDIGEEVVKLDNSDGDGGSGYGFNGTLSWEDTWLTGDSVRSTVNAAASPAVDAFNHPDKMYRAQIHGNLAEITDSVFYANDHAAAYTQADARGVTVSGDSNPARRNIVAVDSPIRNLVRGATVVKGGKNMQPVTLIDPRPANDALTAERAAPAFDDFLVPAFYRGGFAPDNNWLDGWTAAYAYGMTDVSGNGSAVKSAQWTQYR